MARAAAAEQETTMDPELWGTLQYHIGLETIYAKLPFRHFFHLRVVCKEWNRLSRDKDFLHYTYKEFLLPEPYFVLIPNSNFSGLLARDQRTQQWTWTRLPNCSEGSRFIFDEFWSAAGLALSYSLNSQGSRFVFNLHTRHLLLLPSPLEQTRRPYPYIGMEVDTAARPYQFKIMQGHPDVTTQIYDSTTNAWSSKTAHKYRSANRGQAMAVFAKGVFINICWASFICIYDPANDVWVHFHPPPDRHYRDDVRGLGAWSGRIFFLSVNGMVIRVWELTSITERNWTEVATMPGDLHSWLHYENNEPPVHYMRIQILVSYCFQSILIYAWRNDGDPSVEGGERLVILDLETMEFRKLELPFGPLNQRFPSQGDLYAVC